MSWVLVFFTLAYPAELSLSGRVLGIKRHIFSSHFEVKIEGMSKALMVSRGPLYKCLREGLNNQNILEFTFDAKTLKVSSCQAQL